MGVERVALLLGEQDFGRCPQLFIASLGQESRDAVFRLTASLQRRGVSVETDLEGKSLKSQMRRADKLKARYTLVVGGDELARGMAPLKEMATGDQREVALDATTIHDAVTGP
jgi:histidyl-tRNA synthetase